MEKSSLVHIGDTVRFLNETGEGRVIRFASHHELVVELSDGMEIPYPVNQVVVVKSEIQKEALNTNIQIQEGEIGQLNILLCEEGPINSKDQYSLFLYNSSAYHIVLLYAAVCESMVQLHHQAEIGPFQRFRIITKPRDFFKNIELHDFQMLIFKKQIFTLHQPLHCAFTLNEAKWNSKKWQRHSDFANPVTSLYGFEFKTNSNLIYQNQNQKSDIVYSTHSSKHQGSSTSKKHNQLTPVIDLHFESLEVPYRISEPYEKLCFQMEVFEKELKKAFENGNKSIIFIHGVGNGRLKSELVKRLQQKTHLSFHDASFKEFGFGATQVNLFKHGYQQ